MILLLFFSIISGQQTSEVNAESRPPLGFSKCTKDGCTTTKQSVVLDANWRWVHDARPNHYENCYDGDSWSSSLCPDSETCIANCALDGAGSYEKVYGVTSDGNELTVKLKTGNNVGSRVYLMDAAGDGYEMFQLLNREFTFDVDVSKLPCGLNGALYFVEMDKDGGMSKYPKNKAGAKRGTGYCDAQCPHDVKFINGHANVEGWDGGLGKLGSCCFEFDIWEANSQAQAYTGHPCNIDQPGGSYLCSGAECGDGADGRYTGVCDKDGCDLNPYRLGSHNFFGNMSAYGVDTTKPFTVVTQFLTDDSTDTGKLKEIVRIFVQDGESIDTPSVKLDGKEYNSMTQEYCDAEKKWTTDVNDFGKKGGMDKMNTVLKREGLVLVMSLWDDHAANMLWLDSIDPPDQPDMPGALRGPCSTTSGVPDDVEKNYPDAYVKFGDIRVGTIGSTFGPDWTTPAPPKTTAPPCSGAYGQCGGKNWDGATCCIPGYKCVYSNDYYSQCRPAFNKLNDTKVEA